MYEQGKQRSYAVTSRTGVKATIKTPTERDRRRIFAKMKDASIGAEDLGDVLSWQEDVVSEYVTGLEAYEHRGRKITTGEECAEYGETPVIAELAAEVIAEVSLTVGEERPSGAPSASSGAASSTEGPGTAANAGAPAASALGAVS